MEASLCGCRLVPSLTFCYREARASAEYGGFVPAEALQPPPLCGIAAPAAAGATFHAPSALYDRQAHLHSLGLNAAYIVNAVTNEPKTNHSIHLKSFTDNFFHHLLRDVFVSVKYN